MQFPTIVESSFVLPFALRLIMKFLFVFNFVAFGLWTMQAQAESGVHLGQYQKNLTYNGPVTGDKIIYTLYLPPGHSKDKGPYPLIVFLHGAGGGNASSQVMQSYEAARKAGKIGNFAVVFPEKYGGTVWRDGAKEKRAETNVLKELLPYLEKEHALTRDRGGRTIMGFSMGAAGSIYWGAKYLDIFSTVVALDAGGGTSFTDPQARNYVPEYGTKTKAIQKSLKLRLVQGGLNTKKFRDSLDHLKISYDYFQLPIDIAAYPAGSCCLNKKDPTRKFLHNPICMTENAWGVATWAFIEKSTFKEKIIK
jgi:enterochelin esterase-like enzyme